MYEGKLSNEGGNFEVGTFEKVRDTEESSQHL